MTWSRGSPEFHSNQHFYDSIKKLVRKANECTIEEQVCCTGEEKKRLKVEDKTALKKNYCLLMHGRGELELARAGAGKEIVHIVVTGTRGEKAIHRWGVGCEGLHQPE